MIGEDFLVKIVEAVDEDEQLKADEQYLCNYKFSGFPTVDGKTLGDVLYESGGYNGCREYLFRAVDTNECAPNTTMREIYHLLARHMIAKLAELVALDMFLAKKIGTEIPGLRDCEIVGGKMDISNIHNNIYYLCSSSTGNLYYVRVESTNTNMLGPTDNYLDIEIRLGCWLTTSKYFKVSELSTDYMYDVLKNMN